MENLKIISENQNELFKRKEIEANVDAEVTPSKVEVEKLISEKFSTSPEKMFIKNIKGKFGSRTFKIVVNIYNSQEEKQAIEFRKKKEKKGK